MWVGAQRAFAPTHIQAKERNGDEQDLGEKAG
jgi:hypothetical protein